MTCATKDASSAFCEQEALDIWVVVIRDNNQFNALYAENRLPDNCTMPGGIALDSKPVLAAAARRQTSCDGLPQGPQGWLQLPFPDGERVGANGLLGYIIAVKLVCQLFTCMPSYS